MTKIAHFADILSDSDVPDVNDSGAVSRYEFEGDVTDSWGSNDGTDNTSAGFVSGVRGDAKAFDGSDDVVDIPFSNLQAPFTVSLWVNPDDVSNQRTVFNNDDAGSGNIGGIYIAPGGSTGDIRVVSFDDTDTALTVTDSSGSLSANDWQLITVTSDSTGNCKIYLDSLLKTSGTITTDPLNKTNYDIGNRPRDDSNTFDGDIDDFRIYDRELSASEVSALYKWGRASDFAGSNDGQLLGPNDVTGPLGQSSMSFDGNNDYLKGTTLGSFGSQLKTDFAIAFWFRTTQPDSDVWNLFMNAGRNDNETRFNVWNNPDISVDGNVGFQVEDSNNDGYRFATDQAYNDGNWYHMVCNKQGNTVGDNDIYIDGVAVSTTADRTGDMSNSVSDFNDPLIIGARKSRNDGTINSFTDADVADVRIYNRSLTPQEIQALYQAGVQSEVTFK